MTTPKLAKENVNDIIPIATILPNVGDSLYPDINHKSIKDLQFIDTITVSVKKLDDVNLYGTVDTIKKSDLGTMYPNPIKQHKLPDISVY